MMTTLLPTRNLTVSDARRQPGQEPWALPGEMPVEDLLRGMVHHPRRGRAFVVDGDRHVVGAIEASRLASWLFAMEAAIQDTDGIGPLRLTRISAMHVEDMMSPAPKCVRDSTSVQELVAALVRERAIEAPVVDDDGRLIGQVDLGQVLSACMSETD